MVQHTVSGQRRLSRSNHRDPCDGREGDATADTSAPAMYKH